MAKKSRKAGRDCLLCKWWPKIHKTIGSRGCDFWVDSVTGEVMVATGLRALPSGGLVELEETAWVTVQCDCGNEGGVRQDLLESGLVDRCPVCAAHCAQAERN
jgi:hypothetical protein